MKKWVNQAFRRYFKLRYKRLEAQSLKPLQLQGTLFRGLIEASKHTQWGRQYDFRSIKSPAEFAQRVPVNEYDDLKPYIERMMMGEADVLWSGQVRWFSKSSGTTSDKSKFIPVTRANLRKCHIRGSWDAINIFYHNRPDARQFEQKTLMMGGSLAPYAPHPETTLGDVSAIMIHHTPIIARPFFTPDFKTALLSDWEEKLEKMAVACSKDPNMVMIGGVPTWTVLLLRRILEMTGKQHMLEVWPDFQGYIHGGVSFKPYKQQFWDFFPSEAVSYQEIYNASEGFFAVQNDFAQDDLLLLLDNGIYYEFLPVEEWGKPSPIAIPLAEVQVGKNYALVISTNSGLWRYLIGDTVMFTSVMPYKIRVTGRTKQFINAFGEEIMVENTDKALSMTCQQLSATVAEYTVAPIYFGRDGKGGHEWLIEFEKPPLDLEAFVRALDANLQLVNSDYEAKRHKGMALARLQMKVLPAGTFHKWLRTKGKFGGQHKVPRLANHRQYVEEILEISG